MTFAAFGRFVAAVPTPMAIGTIRVEDGEEVKGFLCEPCARSSAPAIFPSLVDGAYLAAC